MPHYAFTPPRVQTSGELSTNVANALTSAIDIYTQGKKQEEAKAKQQKSLTVIQDPKSSNIQKAIAWGDINPKVQEELVKQEQINKKQDILKRIVDQSKSVPPDISQTQNPIVNEPMQDSRNIASRVPNVNELRQEFSGNIQQSEQVSPQMQGMGQPQQQQPVDPLIAKKKEAKRLQELAIEASTVDPTVGNQLLQQSKALNADVRTEQTNRATIQAAEIKSGQKKESERINHIIPIQQKAIETAKATDTSLRALDDQLAAVKSGKVGPLSGANFSNYLKKIGIPDAFADAMQTPEGALFNTAAKEIVTATLKPAFGARPLGIEFEAVVDMLAKTGRKKEANEIVIKSLKIPAQIDNEVSKFTMKLLQEEPNIGPIELQSATFNYREQVTDILKSQWDQEMNAMLESGNVQRKQVSSLGRQNKLSEIWK